MIIDVKNKTMGELTDLLNILESKGYSPVVRGKTDGDVVVKCKVPKALRGKKSEADEPVVEEQKEDEEAKKKIKEIEKRRAELEKEIAELEQKANQKQ